MNATTELAEALKLIAPDRTPEEHERAARAIADALQRTGAYTRETVRIHGGTPILKQVVNDETGQLIRITASMADAAEFVERSPTTRDTGMMGLEVVYNPFTMSNRCTEDAANLDDDLDDTSPEGVLARILTDPPSRAFLEAFASRYVDAAKRALGID